MDSALSPVPLVFKPKPLQLSLALDLSLQPIGFLTPAKPWRLPDDIEGKIARAERPLSQVMRKGMPVCVSWWAGKDSSSVLNLLLSAASKLRSGGEPVPPIVVTHADTVIENPEIGQYARREMLLVADFARRHVLNVAIEISTPNLSDQWAVRVTGGRALPPFPGTNRDCTIDWKVSPMRRLRKKILKRLQSRGGHGPWPEPVVLPGTRYDESAVRLQNMRERGESDIDIAHRFKAAMEAIQQRNESWAKGALAEALDSVCTQRKAKHVLACGAYTSQMDSTTGLLQGKRVGDKFYRENGDVLQADHNAALKCASKIGRPRDISVHALQASPPDPAGTFSGATERQQA